MLPCVEVWCHNMDMCTCAPKPSWVLIIPKTGVHLQQGQFIIVIQG